LRQKNESAPARSFNRMRVGRRLIFTDQATYSEAGKKHCLSEYILPKNNSECRKQRMNALWQFVVFRIRCCSLPPEQPEAQKLGDTTITRNPTSRYRMSGRLLNRQAQRTFLRALSNAPHCNTRRTKSLVQLGVNLPMIRRQALCPCKSI
jgi:hypothetical protein